MFVRAKGSYSISDFKFVRFSRVNIVGFVVSLLGLSDVNTIIFL
jgi:hypothetical protein